MAALALAGPEPEEEYPGRFDPTLLAVITVALLAAGMSTLDGILVALSSIAANDLFLNLTERSLLAQHTPEQRARYAAYRAGTP